MVFYIAGKKIVVTYAAVLLFVFINLFFMKSPDRMVENDMAYKDLLKIQVAICSYFDTEELKEKTIATDFPITPCFFDTRLGYVSHTGFHLAEITDQLNPAADYYIYTNPGNLEEKKVLETNLQLVKQFKKGAAEGFIYKVVK
jgi:hypothetical protein